MTEPKTARELIEAAKPQPGGYPTDPDQIPAHYWPSQELTKRARLTFEPMLEALEAVRVAIDQGKRMYKPEKPGVRLYLLDDEIALIRRALSIADGKEPR